MFRRLTYLRLPDVIIKIEFTTLTASARAAIKTYTTKHSTTKNWSSPIKQIRPIKIKPYQNNTTNQFNTKTPLKSSKKLIDDVRSYLVNEFKIKYLLENSLMLVTALTPEIGYDKAAHIAKIAYKNGTTLKEEVIKAGLVKENEYDKLMNPLKMTKPR